MARGAQASRRRALCKVHQRSNRRGFESRTQESPSSSTAFGSTRHPPGRARHGSAEDTDVEVFS